MAERLGHTLQENVLCLLAYRDDEGKIVSGIIQTELFEGDYRTIAERILEYWDEYRSAPKQHTPDLLADIIDDPDNRHAKQFTRILHSMVALSDSLNTKYVLDQLHKFTRMQKLKSAIVQSAERLNAQQEFAIAEVEQIWNDLLKVREVDYSPGMKLTDIEAVMDYMHNKSTEFSMGIKEFDQRYVVPARGEVMLLLGATGAGKTWAVVHIGKQALLLNKKVLHISLEMPAEQVLQRYYQSLFAVPKRDGTIEVRSLETDQFGRIIGLAKEEITPEFTLSSPMLREEIMRRLDWKGARFENLIVKRFGRLTMSEFESYLDNLELVDQWIPDLVIIDYFGLVKTATSGGDNHRLGLGNAFVDFRAIMIDRHMAGVTPQQSSKAGAMARTVQMKDVAEDWSLTNTADKVLMFSSTAMEKKYGLGRLYVGKARDEGDQFGVLLSQSYATGQFVLQSTYLGSEYFSLLDDMSGKNKEEEDKDDDDED